MTSPSPNARRPECQSAQASVGADDKKSLLVTLGLPEDVAAAAVATDGSKGYKASKTRTALFYTLKVNADAKAEWKRKLEVATATWQKTRNAWDALPEHLKLRKAPRNRVGEGTNKASRQASKRRYEDKQQKKRANARRA